MKPLFSRNIGNKGRLVRGVAAFALLVAAWFVFRHSRCVGVLLGASGGFVLFEALRGWCILRACGIKTKL